MILPRAREKGFTLIELVISIAIIAILVSVAVPTYRKYVRRAAIADIYRAMSALRTPVELAIQVEGGTCGVGCIDIDRERLGLPVEGAANDPLARCGSFEFGPWRDFYILTCSQPSVKAGGEAIGGRIQLSREGEGEWKCFASNGFDADLVPKGCTHFR